jgi:hypothetical protein
MLDEKLKIFKIGEKATYVFQEDLENYFVEDGAEMTFVRYNEMDKKYPYSFSVKAREFIYPEHVENVDEDSDEDYDEEDVILGEYIIKNIDFALNEVKKKNQRILLFENE